MAKPIDPVLAEWGRNIRERRQLLNGDGRLRSSALQEPMSQRQLGEAMDPPVHQSTVARWESGAVEPRRLYKQQLAGLLQVSTSMLFPMAGTAA